MALADIYVLDHAQSFLGEPIHNLYTYERLGTGSAQDLIDAFQSDMLPAIRTIQASQIKTDYLKAWSLGNLSDMAEEDISSAGLVVDVQMLPVFNAINYSMPSNNREVRGGSKRIAGVPENFQVDGTITDAGYIATLNLLKVAYGAEISVDTTNFWRLSIVKRIKYNPDEARPEHFAYRYPEAGDPLVVAQPRAISLKLKVSHQVSRGN